MQIFSTSPQGQKTDSPPVASTLLNEVDPKDHVTSKSDILESRPSTAYPPPTDFSMGEVTPTVPPPSQPPNDTSLSPAISQTPATQDVTTLNTETASEPGKTNQI